MPKTTIADDKYGFGVLANTLSTLLTSQNVKPPITIAIDAPWESGKSSILRMSETMLNMQGVKSVFFNLWYHQDESNTLSALMRQMLDELTPRFFSFENIVFRCKLFWHRVLSKPDGFIWTLVALFFAFLVLSVIEVPPNYQQYGYLKYVVFLAAVISLLTKLRSYVDENKKIADEIKSLIGFKNFDEHIGLRDSFQKELKLLIETQGRVVLFLDDLDRCSDKDIFLMMKTINFLASIDNLFIVMAVDKEKVSAALKREFTDDKVAEEYLEKIFNITLKIPVRGSKFYEQYALSKKEKLLHAIENEPLFVRLRGSIEWMGLVLIGIAAVSILRVYPVDMDKIRADVNKTIMEKLGDENASNTKSVAEQNSTANMEKNISITPKIKQVDSVNDKPMGAIEDSNKSYIFPKNIEKNPINYILFAIAFMLGVLVAGVVYFLRQKKDDKALYAEIQKVVDKVGKRKNEITPRGLNILFNKIVFLVHIGHKRTGDCHTFGRAFELAAKMIYSYILLACLWIRLKNAKEATVLAFGLSLDGQKIKDNLKIIDEYLDGKATGLAPLDECIDLSEYVDGSPPIYCS